MAFFKLLRVMNLNCFDALLKLPPQQFKLIMDSIVWATKHTMRDIGDLGLMICVELIDNVVAAGPATSNGFFQAYYLALLQDMFFVLTDADHKSGFKSTARVLARLFKLVEQGDIQVPLDPAAPSNPAFVAEYTANLLKSAFPHLQMTQITAFIAALREQYGDFNKFRITLRDFLSTFSGGPALPRQLGLLTLTLGEQSLYESSRARRRPISTRRRRRRRRSARRRKTRLARRPCRACASLARRVSRPTLVHALTDACVSLYSETVRSRSDGRRRGALRRVGLDWRRACLRLLRDDPVHFVPRLYTFHFPSLPLPHAPGLRAFLPFAGFVMIFSQQPVRSRVSRPGRDARERWSRKIERLQCEIREPVSVGEVTAKKRRTMRHE